MKKLLPLFAVFALPLGAHAFPVTYTDNFDANPDAYLTPASGTHGFTHDINDDGFDASRDTVLSVMLDIGVSDDGDYDYSRTRYYRYTTWCGRHSPFGRYHCHYSYRSYTTPGQPEYLSVTADGKLFGQHEVDYNPLGFAIDPADVQADGLLAVTLRAISGDLWFRDSRLTVNVDRRVSVPEPATIALLGLCLLGFGLTRAAYRRPARATA